MEASNMTAVASPAKQERWAFSEGEIALPFNCNGFDVLVAYPPECELGVIVYRNGTVSNFWADGTCGIPIAVGELAGECESLYHPDSGEETSVWRDVLTDADGNLRRLLDRA